MDVLPRHLVDPEIGSVSSGRITVMPGWVKYTHESNDTVRVDFELLTRSRPGPLILKYFSPGCSSIDLDPVDRGPLLLWALFFLIH